jgi:hypothetical protein
MNFGRQPRPRNVSSLGAVAGSVLRGVGLNNRGLRLRVLQGQEKGHEGPIQGLFVILDAGDNMHASSLADLLHSETDAREVLGSIRERHPGCVNVANANILAPE